jgi:hypothetical protein
VIAQLEKKIAGLNLEESKKSPIQEDLDKGSKKVGDQDRKLVKGVRKT